MKTVKVHVAAGPEVEDARRAVEDVLELLNRHFRPRGVEFVGVGEDDRDWTVALYWKDFGGMAQKEFEEVYEGFKKEKKPVIHVFFKEPDEGIAEGLKAFKESFAERYGHFYCHFETIDSVKFQMTVQSLSFLQGWDLKKDLKVGSGEVWLGNESVAKLENLPFAKLNSKRRSLLRQINAVQVEIEGLETDVADSPDDEDLWEALRDARVRRQDLEDELKQYDGFLFSTSLFFARESGKEMDERVRQARDLFERGRVTEANKLLDLPEMIDRANRNLELFSEHRANCEKDIQAFLAKAEIVLMNELYAVDERFRQACEAYDNAIRIAREIPYSDENLVVMLFNYGYLLQCFKQFDSAIRQYDIALAVYQKLEKAGPGTYELGLVMTLLNLADLHKCTNRLKDAEREYGEVLVACRKLVVRSPEIYEHCLAGVLNNLANLHSDTNRFEEAEREYGESLTLFRKLAMTNPGAYEWNVALTLNNLANLHSDINRLGEAEREYGESLVLYRKLTEMCPCRYAHDLAAVLNNLADFHSFTSRFSEAESEYGEALALYRRLAARSPNVYDRDVALTLNNLAILHHDTNCFENAEHEYGEALALRRKLAETCPEAYEPDVAITLNNLANLHSATSRLEEAERAYGEALTLFRKLVAMNPNVYEPYVANILKNLAVGLYGLAGRERELVSAATEALELFRKCEARTPGRFEEQINAIVKWLEEHSKEVCGNQAEKGEVECES